MNESQWNSLCGKRGWMAGVHKLYVTRQRYDVMRLIPLGELERSSAS